MLMNGDLTSHQDKLIRKMPKEVSDSNRSGVAVGGLVLEALYCALFQLG